MDVLILDLAGIEGESTLTEYKDKIQILSYSHGVAQQIVGDATNTKRTSGRPNHQDLTVTKFIDLASCKLIDHCNQATVIATLKLTVGQENAGTVIPFMVYDATNVLVSSVSVGGGGGGVPQETVTFNYTKMTWTYTAQATAVAKGGNDSAIWDLALNEPK